MQPEPKPKPKAKPKPKSKASEPLVLTTPAERGMVVQEIRREMLNALVNLAKDTEGYGPPAAELTVFRELCKDYESPSSLQLQALESRIQTLENMAATTEVKYQDGGPIMMGP